MGACSAEAVGFEGVFFEHALDGFPVGTGFLRRMTDVAMVLPEKVDQVVALEGINDVLFRRFHRAIPDHDRPYQGPTSDTVRKVF